MNIFQDRYIVKEVYLTTLLLIETISNNTTATWLLDTEYCIISNESVASAEQTI